MSLIYAKASTQEREEQKDQHERERFEIIGGMVFSSPLLAGVVNVSANVCQYIACNPERLSSEQVLYLLFCFPFQQFRRFALCLWTFFCFPPPNPYVSFSDSDPDLDDSHSD
ncbi:unnamed protein product [Ilex paraguariensis]|uniref:Uncharacterized protein n=1 Tax=Ilex paraguariensis TaxID=185542 RepID=A0ABC8QWD5_9AQUA